MKHEDQILTRGKTTSGQTCGQDCSGEKVKVFFGILPERARLAGFFEADKTLSPEQRLLVIQDLYSLYSRDFTVLYLPGMEPVDGMCPNRDCFLPMNRCVCGLHTLSYY